MGVPLILLDAACTDYDLAELILLHPMVLANTKSMTSSSFFKWWHMLASMVLFRAMGWITKQ